MNNNYVVGLDFGTLSGRAVVVRANDGAEMGAAVHEYPHGVMDRTLSAADGRKLPPDFALQDPVDYLETLETIVRGAVKDAGVDPDHIVGIGLDVTSATVVAATKDGTPLCQLPEFRNEPHAWVKLWKHHGAQDQADRIVKLAQVRREPWLTRYGGILSSEMLMPKVLETLERAPQVYRATDVFCNVFGLADVEADRGAGVLDGRFGVQTYVPGREVSVPRLLDEPQPRVRRRFRREDERPGTSPGSPGWWPDAGVLRASGITSRHHGGQRQH